MARFLQTTILGAILFGTFLCLGNALPPAPEEPPFHALLKKTAGEYRVFGRVDDEMRWAPFLCRMPMPGVARVSASQDEKTHGRKLYSLFARDREAYWKINPKQPALMPIGQTLVKESWVPEEVPAEKVGQPGRVPFQEIVVDRKGVKDDRGPFNLGDHFWPYGRKDGKLFKATRQADLFIMIKLDPKTPNTDQGWVYGTVSPDGKKVTSAGRVDSCMKCHQDAKVDRLFGLRP